MFHHTQRSATPSLPSSRVPDLITEPSSLSVQVQSAPFHPSPYESDISSTKHTSAVTVGDKVGDDVVGALVVGEKLGLKVAVGLAVVGLDVGTALKVGAGEGGLTHCTKPDTLW